METVVERCRKCVWKLLLCHNCIVLYWGVYNILSTQSHKFTLYVYGTGAGVCVSFFVLFSSNKKWIEKYIYIYILSTPIHINECTLNTRKHHAIQSHIKVQEWCFCGNLLGGIYTVTEGHIKCISNLFLQEYQKMVCIFRGKWRKKRKTRWWPSQTDLPRLHMSCPEIHGPWWFRRSLNHRLKNPPAGSELSLKSLCCCQPWQEAKEAPNCPNYQKLQGMNRERHKEREHSEAGRR